MTAYQLREKYLEVFGEESRSNHKEFLFKRIAWRLQALAEGDISERARQRAKKLANDADLRVRAPAGNFGFRRNRSDGSTFRRSLPLNHDRRLPMPGAVLTRKYRDETIRVTVLDKGFEYEGEIYRSLSAVAKAVTGTQWNGFEFFGLRKKKGARK